MPRSLARHARATPLPPTVDVDVFRQMADRSNEGFYLVDRRGRFLYVNAKGHAQMGGYTMEELLSLTVADICPDISQEQFEENIAAAAPGPFPTMEAWTRRKDGSLFLCEVSTASLEFRGELQLFGVARDVTERNAVEAVRKHLALRLLQTIEEERQRVARELHDDVGQALATIGVLLDAIEMGPPAVPESVRPSLARTRATIATITESLARIVREYHPAELLGLGLEDTLRAHTRHFAERHGLALRLDTEPVEGVLTPEQELHVYRVVQEALVNVARHARARSVDVALTREAERLVVRVRDDGAGIVEGGATDATGAEASTHGIGLVTMRERATLLQAELSVESADGKGTTVQLVVPLAGADAVPPPPAGDLPPAFDPADPLPAKRGAPALKGPARGPLPEALDREVFRRMADMASEALMLADHDARFVYVNDRACTLSGFSRDELLTMRISDLNPDFPLDVWKKWSATTRGAVPPFESRHWCKDGSLTPVEISAARIERPGDPYFFAVIRDIRDRKETEAAQHGFTRRLLHTLEAERRRVARELHDEVGQGIAAVGVLLHTLERTPGSIPESLDRELAATYATIRQITESVARIVRDYHPADLLALGLEETVRTHACQFAQRHGLELRLATIPTDGLLSDESALHVYRIVQEALANVARHAHARRVSVRLVKRWRRIVVSVRDDGIGFEPARTRAGRLGLVAMRERAALMGGVLDIRSRPRRGTDVRLTVDVASTRGAARARAAGSRG
ncbi:MAG TPA: PAS domain S-box protein [Candidatus Binatia bacterium]